MSNKFPPFAEHGYEKMLYDNRMGPQAVLHDGVIYVVYHGAESGIMSHPHIISYSLAEQKWSEPVLIATVHGNKFDHHFAPVLWFDASEHIHILYYCHGGEGIHLISKKPKSIDEWEKGPTIADSITYPHFFVLPNGTLLLYYRVFGHMGYWTYILSYDGGYTWSKPVPIVDFDQDPKTDAESWAGSYHSVVLDEDKRTLHVGFVYFDERGMWKYIHPRYNKKLGVITRYNLYYIKIDIFTGDVTNVYGDKICCPINKRGAEPCKIMDTDDYLTNMPSVLINSKHDPSFLLTISEETPYKCGFYYVYRNCGRWNKVRITSTNNMWSGSQIYRDENGAIVAYLICGDTDGSLALYGGGKLQKWMSYDNGATWEMSQEINPDSSLIYNNPQFVVTSDGEILLDRVLFFGWEGPNGPAGVDSTASQGKAFMWEVEQ